MMKQLCYGVDNVIQVTNATFMVHSKEILYGKRNIPLSIIVLDDLPDGHLNFPRFQAGLVAVQERHSFLQV